MRKTIGFTALVLAVGTAGCAHVGQEDFDGGLVGGSVRSVSYGEDVSRLVRENASGPGVEARASRRMVLVVEHAGTAADEMIMESEGAASGTN